MAHSLTTIDRHLECAIQTKLVVELELALIVGVGSYFKVGGRDLKSKYKRRSHLPRASPEGAKLPPPPGGGGGVSRGIPLEKGVILDLPKNASFDISIPNFSRTSCF